MEGSASASASFPIIVDAVTFVAGAVTDVVVTVVSDEEELRPDAKVLEGLGDASLRGMP